MLNVKNLTKSYGSFKAVDDVSFHLKPASLTAFIGHNGAGKTTSLKSIAGILDFEAGEIEIAGYSITKQPLLAKQQSAFLPDSPMLYDFLTGIAYLEFIADIYAVAREKRKGIISKYSEAFELSSALADPINSYSHGMKQKLALISAFLREPKLLILDEPFVGLDPVATHRLKGFLRDLCDQGGAVLFSTHVLEVAQNLCDKLLIIRKGKIVAAGDMKELTQDSSLESVFLELESEAN